MFAVLRWFAFAVATLSGAAAMLAGAALPATSFELALSPPFTAYGEHGFNTRLPVLDRPPFVTPSDGKGRSEASQVTLLEDGRPLGPAHLPHSRIADEGAGGFSHWGETLYFSASDNTDPNHNGRAYRLRVPLLLPLESWPYLAAVSVLGFALWLTDRRLRARVATLAFGAGSVIGVGLLGVNVFGLVIREDLPARFVSRPDDTTIDEHAARVAIDRARRSWRAGELDDPGFLGAMNAVVNARMTNVHQRFVDEEHAMTPRIGENWLLVLLNQDGRFDDYEYQDPLRALRRGLGTCGAQVITLLRLLEADGFGGHLWGSSVHVVARVSTPSGEAFVLDPDYGVLLSGTPEELARDPTRVHAAYAGRRQRTSQDITPVIDRHYASAGARHDVRLDELSGQRYDAARFHGLDPLSFERWVFLGKWFVPALLLLPAVCLAWLRRRAARRDGAQPPSSAVRGSPRGSRTVQAGES